MGFSVIVVDGITDPATLEATACNEAQPFFFRERRR
jgi:hypothetical protein